MSQYESHKVLQLSNGGQGVVIEFGNRRHGSVLALSYHYHRLMGFRFISIALQFDPLKPLISIMPLKTPGKSYICPFQDT